MTSHHRCWRTAAAALLAMTLAVQTNACVYLMGEALDTLEPPPPGTHWNYGLRGDDWNGVDGSGAPWKCTTGLKQSPLPINPLTIKSPVIKIRTSWSYTPVISTGTNVEVFNNGHTIQVQWAAGALISLVQVPAAGGNISDILYKTSTTGFKPVIAEPLQLHFHTDSEHVRDGVYYPLEMHIVHRVSQAQLPGCPATGCLFVTGVLIKLDDSDKPNPALAPIFDTMSEREGAVVKMPAGKILDINALLPPVTQRRYQAYEGSLTTPPCTEGLLWHVFSQPITMSMAQMRQYQHAVGLKECVAATGRRMLANPNPSFERGAYSGFTLESAEEKTSAGGRSLLQNGFICHVTSYGFTNRNTQPLNGRKLVDFTM